MRVAAIVSLLVVEIVLSSGLIGSFSSSFVHAFVAHPIIFHRHAACSLSSSFSSLPARHRRGHCDDEDLSDTMKNHRNCHCNNANALLRKVWCQSGIEQHVIAFMISFAMLWSPYQIDIIVSSSSLSVGSPASSAWTTAATFSSKIREQQQQQYHSIMTSSEATAATTTTTSIVISKSQAWALTEQQLLVADVWKEVTRQYVDPTFNGLGEEGWKQKRLEAVQKVTAVADDNPDVTYSAIRGMLSALGDPYTRFLTPDQYNALTTFARGDSAGIGVSLQVMESPNNEGGSVVAVANVVPNSPAQKANILPGDVILEVDGMNVQNAPAELVAAKCRGEVGSTVSLLVQKQQQDVPSKAPSLISLTRAQVKVNPVQVSQVAVETKDPSKKKTNVGVVTVSAFSQETTSQIVDALRELEHTSKNSDPPVSTIVMDLRGNAGGYMPAGVDVAKLFLPPQSRIISEVDKSGRATIYIADGIGSDSRDTQLYLLVDSRTASASEILVAALHDNHRATVVGTTKTFGKGRIQNVQQLFDGSGVSVTKAKYMTPNGKDIHGIGIEPDIIIPQSSCKPSDSATTCLTGIL